MLLQVLPPWSLRRSELMADRDEEEALPRPCQPIPAEDCAGVLPWELRRSGERGWAVGTEGPPARLDAAGARAAYARVSSPLKFQPEVAPLRPRVAPRLPRRGRKGAEEKEALGKAGSK